MSRAADLEPILQTVEPAVRLVTERQIRKILHYLVDRGRSLPVNPDLPLRVSRAELLDAAILPLPVADGTRDEFVLLTDPDDRMIADQPLGVQLRAYWELIYAERVSRDIGRRLREGEWTAAACRHRLERLGGTAVREARHVLESEHLLAWEADDAAFFQAFAATYLRLLRFTPSRLGDWFPSLPSPPTVCEVLGEEVCDPARFETTRPAGAADPVSDEPHPEEADDEGLPAQPPSPGGSERVLRDQAVRAARVGNFARLAIVLTQLAILVHGRARRRAMEEAAAALKKLVDQLGEMFAWPASRRTQWQQALRPLVRAAADGVWPRAARALAELQRVATDLSREPFAVDPIEPLRTFGRKPLRRPLPHARPVRILMALKQAHYQVLRSNLGAADRQRLGELLQAQIDELEHAIRTKFAPLIAQALHDGGLVPRERVEEVARDKLVAELLDHVCDRGYLRMGDLRDAVARNRLKMADVSGVRDLIPGDALLRADSRLAASLDGVYRRGEFYLRWIQRISSLFFGTEWGRLLVLFVAAPFGGSFLVLMFLEEMRHVVGKFLGFGGHSGSHAAPTAAHSQPTEPAGEPAAEVEGGPAHDPGTTDAIFTHPWDRVSDLTTLTPPPAAVTGPAPDPSWLTEPPVIFSFGFFLLLVIHLPRFRAAVVAGLQGFGRLLGRVFWLWPRAVWQSPPVRALRHHQAVRWVYRHFWTPTAISLVTAAGLVVVGVQPWFVRRWGWVAWVVLTAAYNTPWGWVIQDRIAEAVSDWWRMVRVNLLPGLLAAVVDGFRNLAGWIERQLYAVDEWLRFRGGDSSWSLVGKTILGLLWFPVAYIFRFAFTLLVEPQINPIKHFPVVTVSHKVMLPMVLYQPGQSEPSTLGAVLVEHLGWPVEQANFWAFWGIAAVPGVFGFIAWELVANWQLYRANLPERLRPVVIGSHGETMRGLLCPGLHSGTVPKLFRKLRRQAPDRAGRWHHEIEHVAVAVRHFVERELITLLNRDEVWGGLPLTVARVRLGCLSVVVELATDPSDGEPFVLVWENVDGRVRATVQAEGWLDRVAPERRQRFELALAGLLDMTAVEQIDDRDRTDMPASPAAGTVLLTRPTYEQWVATWRPAVPDPNPPVVVPAVSALH